MEVESAAAAAPPMSGGGSVASSPAFPWPFQPRESGSRPTASPAPGPGLSDREGIPIPFISSNPAVPLPTGEVDSATIRPLPTSDHQKVVSLTKHFVVTNWNYRGAHYLMRCMRYSIDRYCCHINIKNHSLSLAPAWWGHHFYMFKIESSKFKLVN